MLNIRNDYVSKKLDTMWNDVYDSWKDANKAECIAKAHPNESFWYNLRELCIGSARAKACELKYKVIDIVEYILE